MISKQLKQDYSKMSAKKKKKVNTLGAPTKYLVKYNEQVEMLCKLGAIDREIADFLGISESTLNEWKKKYKHLSESIKRGKILADMNVANSLYKKATGYKTKAIKFAIFEGEITDQIEYDTDVAPDATACIFWLKNRQRSKWRDKQEHEHIIKDVKEIKKEIEEVFEQ